MTIELNGEPVELDDARDGRRARSQRTRRRAPRAGIAVAVDGEVVPRV